MKRLLLPLLLAAAPALAQRPAKLKMPPPDASEVFDAVQQPAVPTGGPAAYADYLQTNQHYPTAALRAGQEGTVQVSFVVERSGGISAVAVAQPLAPLLDAEALRLIKAGPKWLPAHHRGALVRQRVTVPVSFVLASGAGEVVQVPAKGEPAQPARPLPPGAVAAAPGTTSAVGTAGPAAGAGAGPTLIRPEKSAEPVGGNAAFFAWLQAHQQYPAAARQRHLETKVLVEFLVQPDGSLTDVRVVQKHGLGLDEEAVRLIRAAPKWTPARYQGRPIKQKMTLPVIFQL